MSHLSGDSASDPVNDLSDWFAQQLTSTGDLIVWAAEQVAPERRFAQPPLRREGWPAARQLFHLALYERTVALPSMQVWLGGPPVEDDSLLKEDALWEREGQTQPYATLIAQFRDVRRQQIELLPALIGQWQAQRPTVWDVVEGLPQRTLQWVVTKTVQHSGEHASSLLAYTLFWDFPSRSGA